MIWPISLALILASASGPRLSVTREVSLMGTSCTLTVFAENRTRSIEHSEKLIRTLEETERELSTWREASALTILNRQPVGVPFHAQPNLCRLLAQLQHWATETAGAFDPGIGSLIEAWGIRTGGRQPSDSELSRALRRSGIHGVKLDAAECRITRMKDVSIDCGAFGKGEALDRLRSGPGADGIWMVNLGGQVAVQGVPPGSVGWEVSIAHPKRRAEPALNVLMVSGSLATSGGSERDCQIAGKRVGHIIDPRTGRPAQFDGSVSVWHESALVADILSTALYVMGPQRGIPWAEARGLAACYLYASDHQTKMVSSRAFLQRFAGAPHPP